MGSVGCLLLALCFVALARVRAEPPKVPAIYVFGDSTADVGNNNYLPGSNAKANYPHYGIDFPHSRPTGRFSNGYNGIDFLANHMGFRRSPPPYLSLTNKTNHQILKGLKGVSFASGGSGILDSTGSTITMSKQIQHFTKLQTDLIKRMGAKQVHHLLSKSIFLFSSGGNDIFAFFSQKNSPNSTEKEQFIKTLVSDYEEYLMTLYRHGARKFLLIDVAPIGCCPYSRTLNPLGACIDVLNDLAQGFNQALKVLMSTFTLNPTWQGVKYSIGSSNALISEIIANLNAQGHTEVKIACCGAGKFNAETRCNPNTTYCANRGHYLFWDMLHPSHATSKKAGLAIYSGPLKFAYPINAKQLVEDNN